MPPSPIRSSTEPLAALALAFGVAAAGCSDDAACGPGSAPASGVTLTVAGETLTYGGFAASVNNDCTVADSGVISVSIHGSQSGRSQALTLCLPRPDLLGATPVALAPIRTPPLADDRVQVIDASAALASGCTVMSDPTGAPTGTVTFSGYCQSGADPAGYAITLAGTVPLQRTCNGVIDAVTGTLGGQVAVTVASP